MGSASVSVKPDGTFALKNVVASEVYDVTLAGAPEDFYLKAARLGSDNVLEEGLSVAPGRQSSALELVLSSAGGQIDGIVVSEQGFDGALVVLVPESPHRGQARLYKTTTPDQYGHFTLRGIAPGDYKLFAWEDIEAGAYQDADFLRPYEERGETLRVVEADHHSARQKLISSDVTPR